MGEFGSLYFSKNKCKESIIRVTELMCGAVRAAVSLLRFFSLLLVMILGHFLF